MSFINIECYTFKNEEELDNFVKGEYEAAASAMCTKSALAQWDYQTDLGNTVKEEALVRTKGLFENQYMYNLTCLVKQHLRICSFQ